MTPEAFLDWLWKIAGGWLNWRPHEFEYANISDILTAYEGHLDKLQAIHGSGENKEQEKRKIASADDFLAAFAKKGIKR